MFIIENHACYLPQYVFDNFCLLYVKLQTTNRNIIPSVNRKREANWTKLLKIQDIIYNVQYLFYCVE